MSKNRTLIEEYYKDRAPNYLFFRAEDAWEVTRKAYPDASSLELEEKLALFSDAVLILVESFGSVAELGAFSLSDQLRKKLLVILDKKYKEDSSFINTGPAKWVNEDSIFKPVIYVNFLSILDAVEDIDERLKRRGSKEDLEKIRNDSKALDRFSYKELLFFIIELIAILGPISKDHLLYFLKEIINFDDRATLVYLLSLANALGFLKPFESTKFKDTFYYCHDPESLNPILNEITLNTISRERSNILGSLLYIDEFKELQTEMKLIHAT